MQAKRTFPLHHERIGGFIAIVLGLVSVLEGYRKYPQRISDSVGDHILLFVIGALLILLGLLLILFKKEAPPPATASPHRRTLFATAALLFLYALLLPTLGYPISTFLAATGLFRVIGTYRIHISLLSALLLTAALYALFVLLLGMTFPTGVLGF